LSSCDRIEFLGGTDKLTPDEAGTKFADPKKIADFVNPEHVEHFLGLNPGPQDCECGELNTLLSRPLSFIILRLCHYDLVQIFRRRTGLRDLLSTVATAPPMGALDVRGDWENAVETSADQRGPDPRAVQEVLWIQASHQTEGKITKS